MALDDEVDGPDNPYFRRYLNDRINNDSSDTGPSKDLDTEVDGEYGRYFRRYLNDKINNTSE